MESGWNLWVWLVGVASGWNLWVQLECIGVVSGCWCKEVYIYVDILIIIINFPYSTCILLALFLAAAALLLCSFKKVFSCSCHATISKHYMLSIEGKRMYVHLYHHVPYGTVDPNGQQFLCAFWCLWTLTG